MSMLEFECDICGATGDVADMIEHELVGEQRAICPDCHEYVDTAV